METANVVVVAPSLNSRQSYSIPAGQSIRVEFPLSIEPAVQEGIESKGILIRSDAEIVVHGVHDAYHASDACTLLPLRGLGTHYFVMSYPARVDNCPEFCVLGTRDGTTVTITPGADYRNHPAGIPYSVVLNEGDIYEAIGASSETGATFEVSGTRIDADHPVAVMHGDFEAFVPCVPSPPLPQKWAANAIFEQALPLEAAGTSFVAVPFQTRAGDRIIFYATANSTAVSVNGQTVANLNAGQTFEQLLSEPSAISSSQPICVAQYSQSQEVDNIFGDPSMSTVLADRAWHSDYWFPSPKLFSFQVETIQHFVDVVAPVGDVDSLTLDDQALNVGFTAVPGTPYAYGRLSVSEGLHHLTSTTGARFYASVYGFGEWEAYSFTPGFEIPDNGILALVDAEITPSSVIGGRGATGRVYLSDLAPAGGAVVTLSSDRPDVAVGPVSVTIPEGSASASFPITTKTVSWLVHATFTMQRDGVTRRAVLDITPHVIDSFTISPTTVVGGQTATATITLNAPAPTGGLAVQLQNGNTGVATIPATVTVPAGQGSVSFSVVTRSVSSSALCVLTASLNGSSKQASLTVVPLRLATLSLTPTTLFESGKGTGVVALNGPAPSGGAVVLLSSTNTAAATVPSSVTIPQGQSSKSFVVTARAVTAPSSTVVKAVWQSVTLQQSQGVVPIALQSLYVTQESVTGGLTLTAVVRSASPAPSLGLRVTLSSSNVAVLTVPTSITIAPGASSANFSITTKPVAGTTFVNVAATHAGSTMTRQIQVMPPEVKSITLSTYSIRGGGSVTGTVTLTGRAPTGGTVVHVNSYPGLAAPTTTVTVPAGSTSVSFRINTSSVTTTTAVQITANSFSVTRYVTLTLTP